MERRTQQLQIIFNMVCGEGPAHVDKSGQVWKKIEKQDFFSDLRALEILVGTMRQLGIAEIEQYGETFPIEAYLTNVKSRGRWNGTFVAGGLAFSHGYVVSCEQSFVMIEEIDAGSSRSWEEWLGPFLHEERFVQAWIADVDYDFWQNAKDPLQYETRGRDYSGLPLVSNGLPPPVEQMEIDTSNNPGRRTLKPGYLEAVGATMWFATPFWQRVEAERRAVLESAVGIRVSPVTDSVIRVVAADACFIDQTSRGAQDRLRAILYAE